eukprot:704490-Amphidinium_carterae.1
MADCFPRRGLAASSGFLACSVAGFHAHVCPVLLDDSCSPHHWGRAAKSAVACSIHAVLPGIGGGTGVGNWR